MANPIALNFTVFAKADRAETSDMPNSQKESIRTKRETMEPPILAKEQKITGLAKGG
jgi:hypothetical protein